MPFWFLGFATILGLTRQGYDPFRDPISRLGAEGTENALVWQVGGFLVAAVLELSFAVALWSAFRSIVLTGLMVAVAVLFAVSAAAPMPTQPHLIAGLTLFACLAVVPIAASIWFRRLPGWAGLWRSSLVVGVALVAWFLLQPAFDPDRLGLWQRAFLVVALGWQVIVALRVRRLAHRRPGPA
jgi:Protein of unknown function (DUF998)